MSAALVPQPCSIALCVRARLALRHALDVGVCVCVGGGPPKSDAEPAGAQVIAGPKFRKAQGVVRSADWSAVLAPFGVVRESDPADWRCLVSVSGGAARW